MASRKKLKNNFKLVKSGNRSNFKPKNNLIPEDKKDIKNKQR